MCVTLSKNDVLCSGSKVFQELTAPVHYPGLHHFVHELEAQPVNVNNRNQIKPYS